MAPISSAKATMEFALEAYRERLNSKVGDNRSVGVPLYSMDYQCHL